MLKHMALIRETGLDAEGVIDFMNAPPQTATWFAEGFTDDGVDFECFAIVGSSQA